MSLNGAQIRKKIGFWLLVITAGVTAYGLGLYQGSHFRMQRMIASNQKAVPVEIPAAAQAPAAPESAKVGIKRPASGSASLSNSPNNTQSPKSHSKSH